MLRTLGADAVGMSTVLEAVAARWVGLEVCGVSLVTNAGAGYSGQPLTHEEVLEAGAEAGPAAGPGPPAVHRRDLPAAGTGRAGRLTRRSVRPARPPPATAAPLRAPGRAGQPRTRTPKKMPMNSRTRRS